MILEFRKAHWGDIKPIAADMPMIEQREAMAFGRSPRDALVLGLKASLYAWTGTLDGEPSAMFGVTPISTIDAVGRPWMLGTHRAQRVRKAFLSVAPGYVAAMQRVFPRLDNLVHAEHRSAIRWLRHLGFAVEDELRHVGGQPFRRFTKGF